MRAKDPRDPSVDGMKHESGSFFSDKDVVFITLSDWEGPRRIRHHLADALARRGNRVLFVEAFYSLSKFLKAPDLRRFFRFLSPTREPEKNLFLCPMFPFLPLGEFISIVSRLNWMAARFLIRRRMATLGFRNVVLVIFAYNADPLVGRLGEGISVYFCNDAFDKLYRPEFLRRRVVSLERRLIRKVDAVITVSEPLTEERAPFAKRISTVHHGVDYELFDQTLRSPAAPEEFELIKRPILGYSGVIRHIIDLELIAHLASQRPDWSVVLVGPVTESDARYYAHVEALKRMRNVHFLGARPSREIPRYVGQFDVCLLPYVLDEVSTYYNAPLKFYEYLAAGKPVISTVGPRGLEESVVIPATTKESFVKAVEKGLGMTSPAQVARRKEEARRNSWGTRVDEIAEFLSTVPGKA